MLDERVEELLGREENKGLFDKLNQASQRVEIARQQLADIQSQEIEAKQMRLYINQLESKAAEVSFSLPLFVPRNYCVCVGGGCWGFSVSFF